MSSYFLLNKIQTLTSIQDAPLPYFLAPVSFSSLFLSLQLPQPPLTHRHSPFSISHIYFTPYKTYEPMSSYEAPLWSLTDTGSLLQTSLPLPFYHPMQPKQSRLPYHWGLRCVYLSHLSNSRYIARDIVDPQYIHLNQHLKICKSAVDQCLSQSQYIVTIHTLLSLSTDFLKYKCEYSVWIF